jgi:phenylpropionate dioxygenase-like ring-hydroxylating dioxygenase large terminal subunit
MATRVDMSAHDAARAGWTPQPTLAGADYTSAEVFELERARLFHARWFAALREDAIGERRAYAVVDVAGERVIVLRDEDGAVRAGRLAETPNVPPGEQLPRERPGLVPVPVELWGGFVWLNVSGAAPPLAEQFRRFGSDDPDQWARYGLGELVIGASREYDVAANWKIIVENYNECLHCPTVHPSLVPVVPLYRHGEVEDAPGAGISGNRLADGLTSFSSTGRSSLPALPGLSEVDANTFYGVTLLPNLIVNYHSDNVSTFHLFPIAAGRTRVVCDYLFRPETVRSDGFDPSEVVDFRHELALEDWAVCERAQQGARSRAFAGGGMLPYADRYLHAFHEQYRAMREAAV